MSHGMLARTTMITGCSHWNDCAYPKVSRIPRRFVSAGLRGPKLIATHRMDDRWNSLTCRFPFTCSRRADIGQHHHIAGPYLGLYAGELALREDMRRTGTGARFDACGRFALGHPPSRRGPDIGSGTAAETNFLKPPDR